MSKNIAVYGGAFNPPTRGHVHVIQSVLEYASGVDKIILVPDGLRHDKDYGISLEHKKRLAELFYEYLLEQGYSVDLDTHFLEGKNGGHTTTMDVVRYFEELYGEDVKHIFGSDVISEMKNWVGNENEFVEKKLKKIFMSRPGYFFERNKVANYEYIETQPKNISSTLVRERIRTSAKVSDLLVGDIEAYIHKYNIYKK